MSEDKSIVNVMEDDIKEAICTVKVKLNDKVKSYSIKDGLNIDYDNLEEEMEKLPHIYQLWAMLYSEVKEQREILEKKIRKRKGIIANEILEKGGKGLRRSDITDLMETDEVLEELEVKYIIVSKQSQKLWYILDSLKMKNDNVRSLSGFKKQEMYQSRG